MLLIVVCGVLVAVAVALCALWGGERLSVPAGSAYPAPTADAFSRDHPHLGGLRYYLWWASVFTVIATATAVLVTGAGGRLVMRALAAASPEARGRLTEAGAFVGFITLEGTLGYFVFAALPFAFLSAALYLIVDPWLPPGRLAGPTFGAILLVTVSPFLDPLRQDNVDFDRVGPGWLSVLLFGILAILQGATLAAIAGRLSRSLPLISRRSWPATAASLIPAIVLFPIGVVLAVGALLATALPRLLPWLLALRASRTGVIAGRILLAVATLVALPAFLAAVISISTR